MGLDYALEPLRRERAIRRYTLGGLRRRYPDDPEELRESELLRAWWYYGVELLPGVATRGQFPIDMPMLPRAMLRRCQVSGVSCLDLGTMEAIVPTLLKKRGAESVLAVDATNHCVGKLAAVRHYHGVDFEFRKVGLMYDLHEQLAGRSFDLVNCSGLLYHVFSPLTVLASVRALVKSGGLVIVSTNVTLDPEPVMDFNARGRMHAEGNTFWFPVGGPPRLHAPLHAARPDRLRVHAARRMGGRGLRAVGAQHELREAERLPVGGVPGRGQRRDG